MCQGDCDRDDECAGSLVCMLKDRPVSVDGCAGYDLSNSDFVSMFSSCLTLDEKTAKIFL
jgi:hypothetical protein